MNGQCKQLSLRAACATGGSPSDLVVSPDASQLFVFDRRHPRITVMGTAGFDVLKRVELDPGPLSLPFFLGARGDFAYCAGPSGWIAVFSMSARQFYRPIRCGGQAVDLAFLPESTQALVAVSTGDCGFIEAVDLSAGRMSGHLALAHPPIAGTLSVLRNAGAVVVRDPKGVEKVQIFSTDTLIPQFSPAVTGGIRSLAFDPGGEFLYAACHEDSEVAVIDLDRHRIVERLLMAGHPFDLQADPRGRRVWVLCEGLGHMALLDVRRQAVSRRHLLPGLTSENRIAFSPGAEWIAIPERESGALTLADGSDPMKGGVEDRLELGSDAACAAWSPLGDELFITQTDSGRILALTLNSVVPPVESEDAVFLEERFPPRLSAAGHQNPLFPP